jgi:predicted RNase H-like HicB family nuclease
MAERPKRYTAYIQWNRSKGYYAGYIPGIGGTDSWGDSMGELKANLGDTLARRLKDRPVRAQPAAKPRPGFRRIDIKA